MQRVCLEAATAECLPAGEVVFFPGAVASGALVVKAGMIVYADKHTGYECNVQRGTWVCEGAMFCRWACFGEAKTASSSELVTVSAPTFITLLSEDPLIHTVVSHYANIYHSRVTNPIEICATVNDL